MQKSTSERKARSSRRVWLVCAAWLTAGLAQAGISRPADWKNPALKAAPETHYLVSAILRESAQDRDDNSDILPLNGCLPGLNASDALNRVLRDATAQYPRHTPVSTLVAELGVARPACSAMSPKRGQWQEV
jgi:hypothetical protein